MKAINLIKSNYILLAIIFIATIARFYHIDFQSVWLDEIHTLNEANPTKSFSEVYEALLVSEPHPPLFFFITHIAFKLFGYTTFVARIVSAIIGIVGVFSIFLLGKEIFNKKEYSLYLFEAWVKWRSLYQFENGGSSKYSKIDNKFYDSKRKEIANVIFSYISKHKKDKMAINQFLVLASHDIIKIHGEYPYGNQNVVEFHSFFE